MVLIPSYCNNKNMSNIHKYERLFYGIISSEIIPRWFGPDQREEKHGLNRAHPLEGTVAGGHGTIGNRITVKVFRNEKRKESL